MYKAVLQLLVICPRQMESFQWKILAKMRVFISLDKKNMIFSPYPYTEHNAVWYNMKARIVVVSC